MTLAQPHPGTPASALLSLLPPSSIAFWHALPYLLRTFARVRVPGSRVPVYHVSGVSVPRACSRARHTVGIECWALDSVVGAVSIAGGFTSLQSVHHAPTLLPPPHLLQGPGTLAGCLGQRGSGAGGPEGRRGPKPLSSPGLRTERKSPSAPTATPSTACSGWGGATASRSRTWAPRTPASTRSRWRAWRSSPPSWRPTVRGCPAGGRGWGAAGTRVQTEECDDGGEGRPRLRGLGMTSFPKSWPRSAF